MRRRKFKDREIKRQEMAKLALPGEIYLVGIVCGECFINIKTGRVRGESVNVEHVQHYRCDRVECSGAISLKACYYLARRTDIFWSLTAARRFHSDDLTTNAGKKTRAGAERRLLSREVRGSSPVMAARCRRGQQYPQRSAAFDPWRKGLSPDALTANLV